MNPTNEHREQARESSSNPRLKMNTEQKQRIEQIEQWLMLYVPYRSNQNTDRARAFEEIRFLLRIVKSEKVAEPNLDKTRFLDRGFAVVENAGHSLRLIDRNEARHAISIQWSDLPALRELITLALNDALDSTDQEGRAREIRFPFPCGCMDAHEGGGMAVEEYTCAAHRLIAEALSARDAEVDKARADGYNDGFRHGQQSISRDAEVRGVLEGLSVLMNYANGAVRCWCFSRDGLHSPPCAAARDLYTKLQPKQ